MDYKIKLNPVGFFEVDPKPSQAELAKFYKEKLWQETESEYQSGYSNAEIKHFDNIARVAEATIKAYKVDKKLLDLGCGQAFFANSFHSRGWDIECCDFSEFGIMKHNPHLINFFSGGDIYELVLNYQKNKKKFGLINLQDVLEHVINPIELIENIKPLFKENTILRIVVPNDYSEFQGALQAEGFTSNTWFHPPQHLSYFNKDSLQKFISHCGYRIISIQAEFPIEIFLANKHSNYWQDRSLGKQAHLARIFCENHLIENNIVDYVSYAEAAAKIGFGRQLIAYVTLK